MSSVFLCFLLTILSLFSDVSCMSDYVQSFEHVAVFHSHITYGHLGVTIDFDGYLNHFYVSQKPYINQLFFIVICFVSFM